MSEKEIKFSEAEIAEKQEEALAMDKQAKEMVEKGEAKTPQQAIEKIEAKELEKSPEEMLKEALPLAWEEALKFTQEKGFASPEEIKKRIDLAKKYNLELEHFFYDPENLERKIPEQEQIEKTAKEMEYVNEFAREFSRQSGKPVFCIFNARNGTIYSYGVDTINAQLNSQFEEVAKKEGKTVQELRDEFIKTLKNNTFWQGSDKLLAWMDVANAFIREKRIYDFVYPIRNFKYASSRTQGIQYFQSSYMDKFVDKFVGREGFETTVKNSNLVVVDASDSVFPAALSEGGDGDAQPLDRFCGMKNVVKLTNRYTTLRQSTISKKTRTDVDKALSDLRREKEGREAYYRHRIADSVFINAYSERGKNDERDYLWWDNFPPVIGRRGREFGHERHLYPTEEIVQSCQKVEYLSEKVKNALRYYQRDDEGRNWFERNFEGIMLGKKESPEKGSQEYLEKFRKWVPYETDEKGEAVLDEKGYPVPRKGAPMTIAAEDELARLEAAMEELSIDNV